MIFKSIGNHHGGVLSVLDSFVICIPYSQEEMVTRDNVAIVRSARAVTSETSTFDQVRSSVRPTPQRLASHPFHPRLNRLVSKPVFIHPRRHTIDPFPLIAKSLLSLCPKALQLKICGPPKYGRLVPRVRAASQSLLFHVAHVAHSPSRVGPRSDRQARQGHLCVYVLHGI